MERLTTDRDYEVDKGAYERHLAQGYPRNMARERFLKLCEYERTGHTPEEIAEFDQMYLEKCEEINRLNAELAELKKQPHGDLISRNDTIKKLRVYADQKCETNEIELANGILKAACFIKENTNIPTAYDVEKAVETARENCYQMGFDESQTEIVVDIIRNGGKE